MILTYKGYSAKPFYSEKDKLFTGCILGIEDSINFHSETLDTFQTSFENAVDGYLDFCKEIGKIPDNPKV